MKATLRYLLIVVAMISAISVCAQRYAQMPEVQMYSTSAMISSGSTLPSAAATGTLLTGSTPGEYNPASAPGGGPRKIGGNTSGGSDDREDPYKDPIGDGLIPLLLLAGAYLIWRATRRRALGR